MKHQQMIRKAIFDLMMVWLKNRQLEDNLEAAGLDFRDGIESPMDTILMLAGIPECGFDRADPDNTAHLCMDYIHEHLDGFYRSGRDLPTVAGVSVHWLFEHAMTPGWKISIDEIIANAP